MEQIIAFEPMSKNYYQLCSNILLNDMSDRIFPQKMALSDQNGAAEIFYDENSTGIGTLDPQGSVRDGNDYNRSENMECRRFDDLETAEGQSVFIKMDVEQHELSALKGMQKFLNHNKIWLMIEINDEDSPVFEFLMQNGFKRLDMNSDDYVFCNVET